MKRLVFGCGYLGERVAAHWLAAGDEVYVVTRGKTRATTLQQQGFLPIVADITALETLGGLPTVDTVLFAVGYDRAHTSGSIMNVYAGGMRNVVNALPPATRSFVYISTTGVYGPAGGEWIDEVTPTAPQREGGQASLAAEEALRAHSLGEQAVILRLAGIYGPGRIPFLNELRTDRPVEIPTTGYLNLIHVEDAASVVVAAAARRLENSAEGVNGLWLYCVSDGVPVPRIDFYTEVARQLGKEPPQFIEADPSSPRAQRASGNRRVSNARMLADLEIVLRYPDYRTGLAAIL